MSSKYYRLTEHTADIGIKVRGGTKRELFVHAAQAMFEIIAAKREDEPPSKEHEFLLRLSAGNIEELFVCWLSELLSLSAAKFFIFCDFKFKKLTDKFLEAVVQGCDSRAYEIRTEIKAVTYHQLRVRKTRAGWMAEVIFDV